MLEEIRDDLHPYDNDMLHRFDESIRLKSILSISEYRDSRIIFGDHHVLRPIAVCPSVDISTPPTLSGVLLNHHPTFPSAPTLVYI